MNEMRTSNPALRGDVFARQSGASGTMTLNGTINKTGLLLLLCIGTAILTWNLAAEQNPIVGGLMMGGFIGGFIVSIVTVFKKEWAGVTAPIYALLEGLALGGLSWYVNAQFPQYPGLALQAVCLTFGVFIVMLALYATGIVKATPLFVRGVIAATMGIALLYLVNFVMGFFGTSMSFINSSSGIGIGFSVFVVALAAFNLILDFALIENGAKEGAPKYMEWYGGFALMVTLIWLYVEILRLLSKLNRR